jgi:hypothetical protein
MSRRRQLPRAAAALALALALVGVALVRPAGVRGQLQTGNLFGVVTDPDSAALPGVTVTLAGGGAPQVQVTDVAGRFRFLGLSPGAYDLTAELEGFDRIEYPNIVINIGRNTEIEVTLTPGTPAMEDEPLSDPAPAPSPPASTEPPPPPPTITAGGPGGQGFSARTEFFRVLGRIELCWAVTGERQWGVDAGIYLSFQRQQDWASGTSIDAADTIRHLGPYGGTSCTILDLPPGTYYIAIGVATASPLVTSWRLMVQPGGSDPVFR